MKNRIVCGAIAAALTLAPARAAEQASYVTPSSGPMSMSTFVSSYLNPAMRALASCHNGASAPANGPSGAPLAYQCWVDTSANPTLYKLYDGASWVTLGSLNTSAHAWIPYLTDGTSGGVPYFSSSGVMASSALLTQYGVVVGGGAGAAPATIAIGTDDQVLFGRSSNSPLFRSVTGDVTFSAGVSAIGASKVTNSQLATMAANTTKCNATAGAANPTDCSASTMRTSIGVVPGTDVQAFDSDLQALASNSTNGIWARTGSGTGAARTLAGPAAGISVGNGDGVSGNPTLSLANDLAALEALAANGIAARTGSDTWAVRTITAPAAGVTVSNGDGVSGNPTLALANDLSALESLSCNGVAVRSATDTWLCRTIGGTANEITVANGDGVGGAPTLSLPSALTFTGKTVTGGTFSGPTITGAADVQQSISLSGDITPTQIAVSTNDYAPTGFSTASAVRLSTDAARNITGLAGGSDGRIIILHNVGSFNTVLTNQDAASSAANRFLFGGDLTLLPDYSVTLRYDATASRWRAITTATAGGGGGVSSVGLAAGVGISLSGTCTITTSGTCTVTNAGIVNVKRQIFTASGTYTPSAGLIHAIIECVGGGGGGAAVQGAASFIIGAPGGGSGGYSRKHATAADMGASKAVTIGSGGAGGVNGVSHGAGGTQTSVGSLCVANGGGGGANANSGTASAGAAGAAAGTGDLVFPGRPGGNAFYISAASAGISVIADGGKGGDSYFGSGGAGAYSGGAAGAGGAGAGYGAGGGGASTNIAAGNNGGAGAPGVVVITEFCTQ